MTHAGGKPGEEKDGEDKNDSDWILIFLGNSMLGTGTALFVIPLARTLTTDVIPGLIRARAMNRTMREGEGVISDLVATKNSLDELGTVYRTAATRLADHIAVAQPPKVRSLSPQEIDETIAAHHLYARYSADPATKSWLAQYSDLWLNDGSPDAKRALIAKAPGHLANEIRQLTPLQMDALIERQDQYRTIADHPEGKAWLTNYEKHRAAEVAAREPLFAEFQTAMKKVETFSHSVNRLSEGFLAWQALRSKVLRYRLEPTPYGAAGKMRVAMNGGFFSEVTEPRDMRSHLHGPITDCQNLMANLGRARSDNLNRSPVQFFLPLAVGGIGAGIGFGLKRLGHKNIEERKKADETKPAE